MTVINVAVPNSQSRENGDRIAESETGQIAANYEDTSVLAAKYGIRPRCTHSASTLVQAIYPYEGQSQNFVCWQCDVCGTITQRQVSADEVFADNLPWLDEPMYIEATTERDWQSITQLVALAFMAQAVR